MSDNRSIGDGSHDSNSFASITLDGDVESRMVKKFDQLVDEGELMWAPYTTETISREGVNLAFQLSPHLAKKPIQSRDDEVRKTGKGKNPFIDPDPNFVVTSVGPHHTLLLNKFCVYRPSLILHTKEFVPQEEILDSTDLHAAWSLIRHLDHSAHESQSPFARRGYMMIYNCGFDSGSSQGHKHMQLWPRPCIDELGFDLFPDQASSMTEIASDLLGTPIRHFVLRLSPKGTDKNTTTSSADVLNAYQKLLVEVHKCHDAHGSTSHNVALTKDWICLIPRRSNGLDRGAGANAAGALGTVWISAPEEKDIWLKPSIKGHLQYIGVPKD